MKRVLVWLTVMVLTLALLPFRTAGAHAEETEAQYAVADGEDVWFYAQESEESGLFLIPCTYYVRVLREGAYFTAVQYLEDVAPYKAVTGFCRTDRLTFVDFVPARPFLKLELKVTYTVDRPNGAALGGGAFDKVERTFLYYGTSYAGTARFYYVYADGVFDYVPAVQEIVYERNTDYLTDVSGEAEGPAEPESPLSPVQIAVICAACAAFLAIAVFVLRGKKAPSPQEEF